MIARRDLIHIGQGLLMGGADIIPGVSGGTVALILGIYDRLVTAISHFDLTFLGHLRRREWAAAARHIDLVFLALLGLGIASGIVLLAGAMHWLLENELQHTYAAFFGMILASCLIVRRMIKRTGADVVLLAIAAAGGAYWLVGLPFLQNPPIGPAYIFACGVIAICAMLLPGISGSFILVILGTYSVITGTLRELLKRQLSDETWYLLFFAAGCGVGLLGFSKFLKWLLVRYEARTMAALFGFMLGSLRKIWPYKRDLNPEATNFDERVLENILPDFRSMDDGLSLVIMVTAGGFVLLLEYLSNHGRPAENVPNDPSEPKV